MAKSKAGVNKAQLVRDAIAALGNDAKPQAIQEYIKSSGGPEIPTVMISSYKSNMKNKPGKKGRKGKAGRPTGGHSMKGGNVIGDIASVRDLLNKYGKPGLAKLIDAVG
ncbi:MAG TPA: hypothetical protein VGJ05_08415 [Fimbriiglobus sp.]|jgi:hypothetical protein